MARLMGLEVVQRGSSGEVGKVTAAVTASGPRAVAMGAAAHSVLDRACSSICACDGVLTHEDIPIPTRFVPASRSTGLPSFPPGKGNPKPSPSRSWLYAFASAVPNANHCPLEPIRDH